jgi:hypothetical protein
MKPPFLKWLPLYGMLAVIVPEVRAAEKSSNQTAILVTSSTGTISAASSSPVLKAGVGPASLTPIPNHLIFSSRSGQSPDRQVKLMSGMGSFLVNWMVEQPVTADELYAVPTSAIIVNSNRSGFLSIEAGKPTLMPVQVDFDHLHSGEYTGGIFLYSTNTSSTIQIIVRVKDRPFWPIIVLITGIVLSFVLSRYRQEGRQHDIIVLQASKLEQMLAADQGFLTAVEFKDSIAAALSLIRNQLDQGRYSDATIQMTATTKMMDSWLVHKTGWIQLFSQVSSLRPQAAASKSPNVPILLAQMNRAAADAASAQSPNALDTAIQALAGALSLAVGGAANVVAGKPFLFSPGEIARARALTTAYLWASYLVMILLFFFVGYKELYDAKPVFGANSFADYFALVLWGFGVETATRTSLTSATKTWGVPGFN